MAIKSHPKKQTTAARRWWLTGLLLGALIFSLYTVIELVFGNVTTKSLGYDLLVYMAVGLFFARIMRTRSHTTVPAKPHM